VLLRTAVRLAGEQDRAASAGDDEAAAWQAFYASPPHRVANLLMAALERLLEGDAPSTP
jgi:phosphorylase kinase alpha/beta subunit